MQLYFTLCSSIRLIDLRPTPTGKSSPFFVKSALHYDLIFFSSNKCMHKLTEQSIEKPDAQENWHVWKSFNKILNLSTEFFNTFSSIFRLALFSNWWEFYSFNASIVYHHTFKKHTVHFLFFMAFLILARANRMHRCWSQIKHQWCSVCFSFSLLKSLRKAWILR